MRNMASVRKTPHGTYEVRYYAQRADGTRVRRSKSFHRKKDADIFARNVEVELQQGTYVPPTRLTLWQYLQEWLKSRRAELRASTWSGYEVNCRVHLAPKIGHISLQHLRPSHIKSCYSTLGQSGISPATIGYAHRTLHKALADAVVDDLISANPASKVSPPRKEKFEAAFLSVEQINALLDGLKEDILYMPVLLALMLGLRRGEVLGLQWPDVDWEDTLVKVRHNYGIERGKPVLRRRTKTDAGARDIVVSARIMDELRRHWVKQSEWRLALGEGWRGGEFVCCWQDGKPFELSHFNRMFQVRLQRLGLPRIRFHDLRHTNASLMIISNVPIKGASARLGHSSTAITQDIYGHLDRTVQERIARAVDEVVWGGK